MLQPKRQKYRRPQKGRGRLDGVSHRGTELSFGSFGIKALQTRWISAQQIEAARVAITRYMQRQGQVWIRIFPDKPITKKPADVRMGKGKGDPYKYVFPAKPGRILFEIEGVSNVQLNVFSPNPGAKHCYIKAGFVEDSLTENAFLYENESWGRCHMTIYQC